MEKHGKLKPSSFHLLPALFLLFSSAFPFPLAADAPDRRRTYIVHVHHPHPKPFACREDREKWHKSFLPPPSTAGSQGHPRLLYSYEHVISGFAAKLTQAELNAVRGMAGFVHAYPARLGRPQTTYTPQFLGLPGNAGLWRQSNYGEGVIIGLLDTGILPGHPSFSDAGMPPPPKKWKGGCDFNATQCNNKLVGARVFADDEGGDDAPATPLDDEGHGTHTASIAAGVFVKGAAVLGNDKGTAAGVAPRAHIAMYKVCVLFCEDSDVLAGMDQAIGDGVDVIAYNVNFASRPFYEDSMAIASLRAAEKGVFVTCSAGNSGPDAGSVSNDFPWVTTVGASTVDRAVKAVVKLDNGVELDGESLYQPSYFPSSPLQFVFPGGLNSTDEEAEFCQDGSLDKYNVKGKVVLCAGELGAGTSRGEVVKKAGGAAMVFMNTAKGGSTVVADTHVLPAAAVTYDDGQKLRAYVKNHPNTSSATAAILFKGTQFGVPPSPSVAAFSSRGPSATNGGNILKPDILGPGVNILGAYPYKVGPVKDPSASQLTKKGFAVLSGTSMSTPHIAGVAALLKASHPDWSPAAIRSAIMTTADRMNRLGDPIVAGETGKAASLFATGAGHVNPSRATDPGLVYDVRPVDYLGFLCGALGYTDDQLRAIARRRVNCTGIRAVRAEELNYPSVVVTLGPSSSVENNITRTVTNVGEAGATYRAVVERPPSVAVSVSPDRLRFARAGKKLSFMVAFRGSAAAGTVAEGALKWVSADGKHVVRSPISVVFR